MTYSVLLGNISQMTITLTLYSIICTFIYMCDCIYIYTTGTKFILFHVTFIRSSRYYYLKILATN